MGPSAHGSTFCVAESQHSDLRNHQGMSKNGGDTRNWQPNNVETCDQLWDSKMFFPNILRQTYVIVLKQVVDDYQSSFTHDSWTENPSTIHIDSPIVNYACLQPNVFLWKKAIYANSHERNYCRVYPIIYIYIQYHKLLYPTILMSLYTQYVRRINHHLISIWKNHWLLKSTWINPWSMNIAWISHWWKPFMETSISACWFGTCKKTNPLSYWEWKNHPNWRTNSIIFQRGRSTTNQTDTF